MKQTENERHQLAEAFVGLARGEQHFHTKQQEQTMIAMLVASYDKEAARAIYFLLRHVPTSVVRQFAYNFLYSPEKNQEIMTDIIVRPIPDETKMKGNTGRYLIFLRHKDGSEHRLKFTNKSATVFYLMHLIDRHNKEGILAPMSLRKNRDAFVKLYLLTYDIPPAEARRRCDLLIMRRDGNNIRAGRQNEVINDIRRHIETAFSEQGENFRPYAMTARAHLAVPPNRIHFEGKAETQLKMTFE